jgi:peptidase E
VAERHIVALGGGSFQWEEDRALDDYVLSLSGQERPRVLFVGTASGDSAEYVAAFHHAYPPERAQARHLPLFKREPIDLRELVLAQDVVYVGGGNTANMLAVWRLHGLDTILREAWEAGVVLTGISAGALCWFEGGTTDSFGGVAALRDGLGLLSGSLSPHYDSEPLRRPTYQRLVATGELASGLAADDGVGLHFAGATLKEAVSARPDAGAYRVERDGDGARETPLPVRRV